MLHHPQFAQHHHQQQHNQQQQHILPTSKQHSSSASSTPQSSTGSDPNSGGSSSSSPPRQNSRVSPASTALVMSNSNISGRPGSRQLSPNTGSSSGGGTGSSSHSNQQQQAPPQPPPNPMSRQFACHAKSMSAGVVVSVPGISSNLATAAGMQQNNMINHNIVNSQAGAAAAAAAHQQQMVAQANQRHSQNQSQHHQQAELMLNQQQTNHLMSSGGHHHHSRSSGSGHQQQQQLVISGGGSNLTALNPHPSHTHRSLHHHSYSQQAPPTHGHHQAGYPTNDLLSASQHESSANFVNTRQATGSSSIVLSLHNNHNRSASTHLSSALLGGRGNSASQHSHHMSSRSNFPTHVANSIWSIDENISKSHGKLTASGYLPHPHLYDPNPSMTDMSVCDNVSNVGRFLDAQRQVPGYYLPNAASKIKAQADGLASSSSLLKEAEFLPICDLLFNLISMIIYFCENTFSIIALIALYYHASNKYWSIVGAAFVIVSQVICQFLSFKWIYKAKLENCRRKQEAREDLADEEGCDRRYNHNRMSANMRNYPCGSCTWLPGDAKEAQPKFLISIAFDALAHLLCLGFLLRYIKLVIPVTDTAKVKREARDLCVLRMIQAFVQSAPLLLLLTYMLGSPNGTPTITLLCIISALLSLINFCWALASFTKYARKKHMHKFVLTWLGILSQFLWRLGTVSSRVAALSIYAVHFNYWMLVILALHWFVMFLWLCKPANLLRDEVNVPKIKRFAFAIGAAWVNCFCYVNFEEQNSRVKILLYYLIIFVENNLLFSVCQVFSTQMSGFKAITILVVYLGFVFGLLFMFIYYKYLHVTVLNNGLSCSQDSVDSIADQLSRAGKMITGFKPGTLRLKGEESMTSAHKYNNSASNPLHTSSHPELTKSLKPPYLGHGTQQASLPQPEVFNCQLTGANLSKEQKAPKAHARRHISQMQ